MKTDIQSFAIELSGNKWRRQTGVVLAAYHHPERRGLPMDADFGVEAVTTFDQVGQVVAIDTPAREVATAVHIGPYDRMGETHAAIHAWAIANKRVFAGNSWEI